MRALEFLESCNCHCPKCGGKKKDVEVDEKASPALCRSTKRLGYSDHCSCVSQGLRPHSSKGKGHTDGNGHYVKGKKAKGVKYGGGVKDYSGK